MIGYMDIYIITKGILKNYLKKENLSLCRNHDTFGVLKFLKVIVHSQGMSTSMSNNHTIIPICCGGRSGSGFW